MSVGRLYDRSGMTASDWRVMVQTFNHLRIPAPQWLVRAAREGQQQVTLDLLTSAEPMTDPN